MKDNLTPLSFGEKIRQIRVNKGLHQEDLAKAINTSKMFVSRLERGQAEYDDKMLADIRQFLSIEHAPIFDHELKDYTSRLWVWHDLVGADRLTEAKDIQHELSPILDLPFERDLNLTYLMIETRILFKEGNFPVAEERLNTAEALLDEASNDALFLYQRNMGFYHHVKLSHKASLKHFLQALDLETVNVKPDVTIYGNVGSAYLNIGKPWKAIVYYEKAIAESNKDRTHVPMTLIWANLGRSYLFVQDYDKAKEILNIGYTHAKRTNDVPMMVYSLVRFAECSYGRKEYEDALDYCNQALELCHNKTRFYPVAIFQKTLTLYRLKDFNQCKVMLEQSKEVAQTTNNTIMLTEIEVVSHLLTLNESNSIDYVEKIAIPYLKTDCGTSMLRALDFCEILEDYYVKKRSTKKALAIAAISRDIYKEMFTGTVELGE